MPLVGIRKNAYSNVDFFAIINTYIQNSEGGIQNDTFRV